MLVLIAGRKKWQNDEIEPPNLFYATTTPHPSNPICPKTGQKNNK
jgi:hypothetical protein